MKNFKMQPLNILHALGKYVETYCHDFTFLTSYNCTNAFFTYQVLMKNNKIILSLDLITYPAYSYEVQLYIKMTPIIIYKFEKVIVNHNNFIYIVLDSYYASEYPLLT